jgi:hypothetical protein
MGVRTGADGLYGWGEVFKSMKWQRAKLLSDGQLLWVEVARPQEITVRHRDGSLSTLPRLLTNRLSPFGHQMTIVPHRIELLPEFSDDVELEDPWP